MGGFRLFTLANIPVWVSPWFLLLLLFFSSRGDGFDWVFAVVVTVSLLVHEMGHALLARRYNLGPQILLHGWGGLTQHQPAQTNGQEALIVAAGPTLGLTLGAVSIAWLKAAPPQAPVAVAFLENLVWVNFVWSAFNLLPLWPMDGGQLFRLGMLKLFPPVRAEKITHVTAIIMIVCLALLASQMMHRPIFLFLILGMMALQNYQAITRGSGQAVRRDNPRVREMMNEAEQAFEDGDDDRAARICQQVRAETNLPPQALARCWVILGVTATRKDEFEEALSYLKRAPDCPEVVEALAQCLYQLEMYDSLAALIKTAAFLKLPAVTRQQIQTALDDAVVQAG